MKNRQDHIHRKLWVGISPWIIIGAVVILLPIFTFMTQQSLNRQRAYTTKLLVEKSAALIRSFEAGARTGIGLKWGHFQLQKLLMETAQQPDIDYLIVTDTHGTILADSDPSLIGEKYGTDLDLRSVSRSKQLQWRQVPNTEGADTFEIYRQFTSARENIQEDQGRIRPDAPLPSQKEERDTLSAGLVIFVGLDMGPIEAARAEDTRNTILIAVIFLLIGISGIISLLLAQGYRSARSSLSRVQAFSDNLVENMPMGLVAMDRESRIIAFNQTAEFVLRKTAGEVIGQMAKDVLPEACRDLLRTLEVEKQIIAKEIDCSLTDGRTIPLEVIATVLEEEDGARGVVVLFRDITEIKQLKKEIAQSQRLASLGSLAAGVAHEIRNPLSSIKGFATYFKERYRDNPDDSQTADIMVQEVDRLNRVIGQLLDYARPMTMNRRETAIQTVIQHALRMIESQAREKGVVIQTELQADVAALLIDPDRIKQVFLNLYLNAIGAMEGGGILSVALLSMTDRRIRIEVRDTGVGIDPKNLDRIFDPYFTTKSSGTGLGLAIVQKIIEAHRGEIQVASTPGLGTTVSVILPEGDSERKTYET
jgi:two-component system sensor histidine kinase HydH